MAISAHLRKLTFAIVLGIAFAGISIQWQPISAKQPIPLPTPPTPNAARSDTAELPTPTIDVLPIPTFSAGFSTAPVLSGFVTFYPGDMVTIRDTDSFDFAWTHITDAKWYKFHLEDEQGKKLIEEKFKPETLVCSESNCVLNSRSLNITFTTGKTYTWWVTSKSPIGKSKTNKSHFTFDLSTSPSLVLIAPVDTRTTVSADMPFSWTHVAGSQWYRIDITNAAGKALAKIKFNHPSDICQSEICSIPLSALNLHFKKDKQVFWSVTAKVNNLKITSPSARTIIRANQPVDILLEPAHRTTVDLSALFTWTEVPGAAWYRLHIIDSTKNLISKNKYVDPASICRAGICSTTLETIGATLTSDTSYKWWIVYQLNDHQVQTRKSKFSFALAQGKGDRDLSTLFEYTFDNPGFQEWMHGTDWTKAYGMKGGYALETRRSDEIVPVVNEALLDTEVKVRVQLLDSAVKIYLRESQEGAYILRLVQSGQVDLYRANELLHSTTLDEFSDDWHTIKFSAIGSVLSAKVDDAEIFSIVDSEPLSAGSVKLQSAFYLQTNRRVLRVDQVKLLSSDISRISTSQEGNAVFSSALDLPMVQQKQTGFSTSLDLPPPLTEEAIFSVNAILPAPPTGEANFSTSLNLPSSDPQEKRLSLYDEYQRIKVREQQKRNVAGCENFIVPQLALDNLAGFVPILGDKVVYDTWQGVEYDQEISIKLARVSDDASEEPPSPGQIDTPVGLKLISRADSIEIMPVVSPDGKQIAFSSNCENEAGNVFHIFVLDLEKLKTDHALQPRQLTSSAISTMNTRPVWSPDGTRIAYESVVNNKRLIYIMDAYEGDITAVPLTPNGALQAINEFNPFWSPDGRYIAYERAGSGQRSIYKTEVYKPNAARVLIFQRSNEEIYQPVISPDGQWLIYQAYETQPTTDASVSDLYLRRLNGSQFAVFTQDTEGWEPPPYQVQTELNLTVEYTGRVASHKRASWSPDMKAIAFGSNIHEYSLSGNVWKIHLLKIGSITPGAITFENYAIWPAEPMLEHGFWLDQGGPHWSPAGVCEGDRADGLRGGASKTDRFLRWNCLLDYRGMAFAAFYHEMSEDAFNTLFQLSDEFSFNKVEHPTPDYMFSRISVNGVLAYSDTLAYTDSSGVLRDINGKLEVESAQGEDYFIGLFGEAIESQDFGWLCDTCAPISSSNHPEELLPDWLNDEVNKAYQDYLYNEKAYKIYIGYAYHRFLPYYYMAMFDVLYRDPSTPNPADNASTDPLARVYFAKTVQLPPDKGPTTAVGVAEPTCTEIKSKYQAHLDDFYSRNYKPFDGPSRHLTVVRYEFAYHPIDGVNYYDVFSDADPSNDNVYQLYGIQSLNRIDGSEPGRGRRSVTDYTFKTWSFQSPRIWRNETDLGLDPQNTFVDLYFIDSLVSRWAGEVHDNSIPHQGEPQSSAIDCAL